MSTLTAAQLQASAQRPMLELAVHEVKSGLSAVLAKVQSGMEAVITSHRKPIAKIVPIESVEPQIKASDVDTSGFVYDKDGYRDPRFLPHIPGMRWGKRKRMIEIDFEPIQMTGEGPTGSEIIDMHRSGINYP